MKKLSLIALSINFLIAFVISSIAGNFVSINPFVAAAIVTTVSAVVQTFVPQLFTKGSLFMGLQVEIWEPTIQEKLLNDNTFLTAISDVQDNNIIGGKIVHIPQAGNPSAVVKNRTSLPATVQQRTDNEVLYVIDEYTTDPVHIKNADLVELSYDKVRSVLNQDIANLSEEVAKGMLTNMVVSPVGNNQALPTANILLTTGSNVTATSTGATGVRKAATLKDMQTMNTFFKKNNAWNENNMYCLLSAELEAQLFPADQILTATYMAAVTEQERREGVMYKVQGWKIFSRSQVFTLQADKTIKAFDAVTATTDCEGAIFWNKNLVEKAIGTTEAFERLKDPTFYGDIYSFLVRMGGRAKRSDYKGVAILMQAPSA